MAYSNTVSQTVFDTRKVMENAFRRCRVRPEQITAEYVSVANDQLYLLLSEMATVYVPMCQENCPELPTVGGLIYKGFNFTVMNTLAKVG